MTPNRKQREADREKRLASAEAAAAEIASQDQEVKSQLSFVRRLSDGWRRVHETNHLAQLFKDEGHLG